MNNPIFFPNNIATNPNAGIYQQPHNFNLSTNVDYTAPTPQFGTGNNIFNADINYTIPTEWALINGKIFLRVRPTKGIQTRLST